MKKLLLYLFLTIALQGFSSIVLAKKAPAQLFENARNIEKAHPDSAIFFYKTIIADNKNVKDFPEIAGKSYRRLALLVDPTFSDSNIVLCQKSIALFKQLKNEKETGITYNTIANIYQRKGYFDLAIQNYQQAASIFEKIHFYKGLTICYSNIASIYNNTEQTKNNLVYNILAYQTSVKEKDSFSMGMIAHDLAISYIKNNKTDSAKLFAEVALKIGNALDNHFVEAYSNKALSEYYVAINKLPEAKKATSIYLSEILLTESDYDICLAYIKNAEIDLQTNQTREAKSAIDKGMEYANRLSSFQLFKKLYSLKKIYFFQTGDYKNAFINAQLYQQYNDSVFSEKRNNTLNELETKYQTVKKEAQIAKQEIKIKQSQTRFIISIILLLVLLSGTLLIYFFLKQRQTLLQNKIITIEQQKKLELTQAIIDGEEQERTRLAKELHDGIGGLMSMIKLQFTNFKKTHTEIQKDDEYNNALDLLNTASQDIRKISHALMPSALERLGLIDAVEQFCTQMQSSGNFEIDFQNYGFEERLPLRFELLVYRIIQELLNNVVKYAEAKEVLVQLSKNEKLISLTVEDDGIGFDISTLINKDGIGLQSMQKRIELLGGKMDIDSNIGRGTSINIELSIT